MLDVAVFSSYEEKCSESTRQKGRKLRFSSKKRRHLQFKKQKGEHDSHTEQSQFFFKRQQWHEELDKFSLLAEEELCRIFLNLNRLFVKNHI